MRATTSVGPPAANGTRSFTGRDGKSAALCAAAPVAAASNTRAVAIVWIAFIACRRCPRILEHDPEKWIPVFGKDHAPAISETAVAHPTGVAAPVKKRAPARAGARRWRLEGIITTDRGSDRSRTARGAAAT